MHLVQEGLEHQSGEVVYYGQLGVQLHDPGGDGICICLKSIHMYTDTHSQ